MTRQRTVKYPPKRGTLTKRQVKRAVEKVIRERLEREAREAAEQEKNPSPAVIRLRKLKAKRQSASGNNS